MDLRSQALEHADLPEVLQDVAEQLSGDNAVTVRVFGPRRRLPGEVEDNLFRIAQEAVTKRTTPDPDASSIGGRRASGFLQVSLSNVPRHRHRRTRDPSWLRHFR